MLIEKGVEYHYFACSTETGNECIGMARSLGTINHSDLIDVDVGFLSLCIDFLL